MKRSIVIEFRRWAYFVILWLLITTAIMLTAELLAVPFLRWLLHDIPYALPAWNQAGRMALASLFISFVAGTATWYHEKHASGR